jgi:hypothetical protein
VPAAEVFHPRDVVPVVAHLLVDGITFCLKVFISRTQKHVHNTSEPAKADGMDVPPLHYEAGRKPSSLERRSITTPRRRA